MQFDMLNGRPCRSGSKFLSDVTQAGKGQASSCFGGAGGAGLVGFPQAPREPRREHARLGIRPTQKTVVGAWRPDGIEVALRSVLGIPCSMLVSR